jgi:8-oxo-dGTP pyrophosphatase MutT (NUDIX family)
MARIFREAARAYKLRILSCGLAGSPFMLLAFCITGSTEKAMSNLAAKDFEIVWRQLQTRLLQCDCASLETPQLPQAAVTLILREEQCGPQALIIKRAEHPRDPWSGHLALPGGRADATDADLLATATREAFEEIGVRLGGFLGRLPKLSPANPRLPKLEITPFVALAPPQIELRLNSEVADAFWVSLPALKQAGMSSQFTLKLAEGERSWPAYSSSRGPIWGITGRILQDFLALFD